MKSPKQGRKRPNGYDAGTVMRAIMKAGLKLPPGTAAAHHMRLADDAANKRRRHDPHQKA